MRTSGATREELDLQREALAKAINHLSRKKPLVRPQSIDNPVNSIFFVDIRRLGWHNQVFERVRDGKPAGRSKVNLFDLALLEYPYATIYEDSDAFEKQKRRTKGRTKGNMLMRTKGDMLDS